MNTTKILSRIFTARQKEIALYSQYGQEFQTRQLDNLLKKARNTELGQQFRFADISNYTQFSEQVPLITYEELKPYVERLQKGETNLTWPSKIRWFAKSSGTTNDKSKFIPVSTEAMHECHYRGGKDCIALYLQMNPESRFFSGKGLILGGSHDISNLSARCRCGDLSAVLIQNINPLADLIRIPDKKIALMPEWEAKLDAICEKTLHSHVTSLSGVPSWFLVLIKQLLHKSGKKYLTEIWPDLEVFFHGGISFEPYRTQYQELIPSSRMHYVETYNASEGFFAIQNDSSPGMLLMLDLGIFFEFIPIEEINKEYPRTLPIWEIETGKNYALVITTNSGLWRYQTGDTVKIVSTHPVKVIVSGRTKHFINAFGEELMVDNAEKGLARTCAETGAEISNYTAAPVYMSGKGKGRHQWLIEFEKMPCSLEQFAQILDATLQSLNSDYEAKRYKGIALDRLEIIVARKNLFHDWLKEKGKLGGQHKIPRLSNQREMIEEMLAMNR
ncbi:MAG: GH3 auxin-responsive promoter family protein [Coprobacter sp.]|nr:GH3 auxin-responsive promoter family protein [Coprobacter sp.]